MRASTPLPRPIYRAEADRLLRILAEFQFEDPFEAFRELYANALDAVQGRGGQVRLSVSLDEVVIEDDGPGLDADGLEALTTLGSSTRRGTNAIGRFGLGFISVFSPALGVREVVFHAHRVGLGEASGIELRFIPDLEGSVSIRMVPGPPPNRAGTRVVVRFDPRRAPPDRTQRARAVFERNGVYSDVETFLDGRRLSGTFVDFIQEASRERRVHGPARETIRASTVVKPWAVAAIDPGRTEAEFAVYQMGLFVETVQVRRPPGMPWPRGVFGAARAEGLTLVASRNGFVRNEAFRRLMSDLSLLAFESAYQLVRYYELTRNRFVRMVLLDALRRGLRTVSPPVLVAQSQGVFPSAVVRSPLFRVWGHSNAASFTDLVEWARAGRLSYLFHRPARSELTGRFGATGEVNKEDSPPMIIHVEEKVERDLVRKILGEPSMPSLARGVPVAKLSLWNRLHDRFLSGPRAEYSLFQSACRPEWVDSRIRQLVEQADQFLRSPTVKARLGKFVGLPLPALGFGFSRNRFGPVAAFRGGEIRFNVGHRVMRRLAQLPLDEAIRGLIPVLAHELTHVCHELHDENFYRTQRLLLRTLAVAAIELEP